MKNPPAFPIMFASENDALLRAEGMTLRDYFAAAALPAVVAAAGQVSPRYLADRNLTEKDAPRLIADRCYDIAEAMLEERSKNAG